MCRDYLSEQGINTELKEVTCSNRERFQNLYTWRLAVRPGNCLQFQAEGSELLLEGSELLCYCRGGRFDQNIISGDDFVSVNDNLR